MNNGLKESADRIKKTFHIGWARAKSMVNRFYDNMPDTDDEVGDILKKKEDGYLLNEKDWNRVVGVGSYYQANVGEWTGKSYNSLKRKSLIGSPITVEDFEYQINTGRDGRHFSLSRWFICLHCNSSLVEGELTPGQPSVAHRCDNNKVKIHRSLKSKFRHFKHRHTGPCIFALPVTCI